VAGYLTRLQGYVYDGEHLAATDLKNGQFVNIANNKATALSSVTDTKARVVALNGPFGMRGLQAEVIQQGSSEVYFVENVVHEEGIGAFDERNFGPAANEHARIHRLLAGEAFVVSSDIIDPTGFAIGEWFYIGEAAQEAAAMTVTKVVTKVVDTSETTDITGAALDEFVLDEGDVIHYSVTVKNTGDLALTGISLADPMYTGGPATIASLASGATSSAISYTHAVTAEEAGTTVVNEATATAAHPRRTGTVLTALGQASVGFVQA
jgi:predicted RecA/RadA family phage recombinase